MYSLTFRVRIMLP